MIAFVVSGRVCGGRVVTRAKKDMSVLMRGHGRVPFRPIPRRVAFFCCRIWGRGWWVGRMGTGTGVVATIRVNGTWTGGVGGILGLSIGGLGFLFGLNELVTELD